MNHSVVVIVAVAAWNLAAQNVSPGEHARGQESLQPPVLTSFRSSMLATRCSPGACFATVSATQDVPPGWLRGTYAIQQLSNGRYLDAYDTPGKDFRVVTRSGQGNAAPRWVFRHESGSTYTIQQENTGRFLDAYDTANRDFAVVTRPGRAGTAQRWLVTKLGTNVYAIQQLSTRRFLDAHETEQRDFAVVTRPQRIPRRAGTIARLLIDKGFGFIRDEDGIEHFFHRSAVRGAVFEFLREGQQVEFTPEDSGKGPRANDVRPIRERSDRTQHWIIKAS